MSCDCTDKALRLLIDQKTSSNTQCIITRTRQQLGLSNKSADSLWRTVPKHSKSAIPKPGIKRRLFPICLILPSTMKFFRSQKRPWSVHRREARARNGGITTMIACPKSFQRQTTGAKDTGILTATVCNRTLQLLGKPGTREAGMRTSCSLSIRPVIGVVECSGKQYTIKTDASAAWPRC